MSHPATAQRIADVDGAAVYLADWRALVPVVEAAGGADAMFADTPYSAKTHAGHDEGVAQSRLAGEERRQRVDRRNGSVYSVGVNRRRTINYAPWTAADVRVFVEAWHPLIRGWFTTITDHVLAPAWSDALEAAGRYVFAPLPYVAAGSRVRITGDGPAIWSNSIVVARPSDGAWLRDWRAKRKKLGLPRALRGAYVLPGGESVDLPVVGGKPPWLLCEMLSDYSLPGETCVDPTCGAGTVAVAAIRTRRRAIVSDNNESHAQLAAQWIANPRRPAPALKPQRSKPGQSLLFAQEVG